MQRESRIYCTTVYRGFPILFWRHCECCSVEVRREVVWRYLGGPYHGGAGVWRYLCGECASNKRMAEMMAAKMPSGMRPIRPPPLPVAKNCPPMPLCKPPKFTPGSA